MERINATSLHRKSGQWGTQQFAARIGKSSGGLRPSFSAQVRFGEPGAPVLFLFGSVVDVRLLNLADVNAVGWQFDRYS
jgi:hypothetical protein